MSRLLVCGLLLVVSLARAVGDPPPIAGPRPATPAELAQLNELLHRTADDMRRWAYTEHRILRDAKGGVKSETLVRYDPSLPYPEQWQPLKIDGREPTERDRAKYRRRGESAAPGAVARPSSRQRRALGELIDVGRSSVASESAAFTVYEIPLIKLGNERFPPEKFRVLAYVARDSGQLDSIAVSLRESFRSRLVVKVKSGGANLAFAAPDPKHPATLVGVEGDATASMLFMSVGGSLELRRTDLKRVRPYDERFEVQIGTLKAIDF